MATKLGLAGAALLTVGALVSCSNTVEGTATCPGCGSYDEPTVATPRPAPPSTATAAPPSPSPAPGPSPTAAPPSGAETLQPDASGYVFIQTKSGKTRCQLNTESVACESQFESPPDVDGTAANGVYVTAAGDMQWTLGNLGAIPAVTLDYRTYAAQGWTIAADASGTRFTNNGTGHGMFVAVQGAQSF